MKLFLLPLLFCLSSCSPQSPYAGVEVNARVRICLAGDKFRTGEVYKVTKAGVQISRTVSGYASPATKKAGEQGWREDWEREEREKRAGEKTYIEFYPWASIVSVTIERPAYHGSWFEEAWDWLKERLFWIG
jgi:hypothetical protein